MQKKFYAPRDGFRNLAVALLVIGCLLYGFSLDRYPGFYVDDAFFAFPALKAALGGSFTYAVNSAAPFANEIWAYHGPIFPHLLSFLFRVFGFSTAVSRLPDFLGGWMAALLIVIFLNRRGYRYAGLAFAILWCGDRAPQELMYGRMDGLALLFLVLSWLALRLACIRKSGVLALWTGVMCGLATLTHPLCIFFAAVSLLLITYWARWRAALWFILGGVLNLPLLFALWNFQIRKPMAQFLWHARLPRGDTALHTFLLMLPVLRWSEYWFISLLALSSGSVLIGAVVLARQGRQMDERWLDFVLAASFGLASLQTIFRTATHPYYIVYFSIWPMLCFVMLAERFWKQFCYVAVTMSLIWCTSAAWNVMRIRESIIFHSQLNKKFLYAELRKDVPLSAEIYTIPALYSVPIEAGYSRYNLTTWDPEQQDICPACYLLITASEFHEPHYIALANVRQRQVIYDGPAFPGAGPLDYPIVVLSPEVQTAN
jgi:hypothetical protein